MKKIQMRPYPLIGTVVEKTGNDAEERKRSTIASVSMFKHHFLLKEVAEVQKISRGKMCF